MKCLFATLFSTAMILTGCAKPTADGSPQGGHIETPPPDGLEVNPAQPQPERPIAQ